MATTEMGAVVNLLSPSLAGQAGFSLPCLINTILRLIDMPNAFFATC